LPPGKPDKPDADVHVYEMYWSDLSRLGVSALQIAYEFFQLLFHIPHLGRQAVDHAVLEFPGDKLWRAYRAVHTAAVRSFTLFVPLLWLTMATTVLSVVPQATPERWAVMLAVGVAIVAGAIAGGLVVYRAAEKGWLSPWVVIPGVSAAAGALVAYSLIPKIGVELVLTGEWVLASTAGIAWIVGKYDRVRPGARGIGQLIAVAAAAALIANLARATGGDDEAIVHRVLEVFEVETVAVLVSWLVFYGLALLSGVLGVATALRARGKARERAMRAAWTARTTLAMSAVGVMLVGMPIWSLLYKAFGFALPIYATYYSVTGLFGTVAMRPWQFIESIFDFAAGPGLALIIVVTAVSGILLSFTVVPSVIAELRATDLDRDGRKESDASNRLGRWLSRGLHVTGFGTTMLYAAVIGGAFLNLRHWASYTGAIFSPVSATGFTAASAGWAKDLVLLSGVWLGATAVGLAAFRGRLQNLMLGIRPVLDAAIDVDNYLREHPRESTPRARIAERYASLLRYLCKWRDRSGRRGYDAIIIVAHSQGTVISADYLSYIKREPDPELPLLLSTAQRLSQRGDMSERPTDGPAMYLFTMGSPLHQLYAEAFPHLFSWVRDTQGPWQQPLDVPSSGIARISAMKKLDTTTGGARYAIDPMQSPNPATIGLERWVNAYRSGDYVGRALWRDEKEAWTYRPYYSTRDEYWKSPTLIVSEDAAQIRRELCIGKGAHTHYWDATARTIASELDALIEDAVGKAPRIERVAAQSQAPA
jgi:hypothetical protein